MTETVLVPVDGSDPADAALEFALEKFPDAHLVVYHSINPLAVARSSESEAVRREFWTEQMEEAKERSEEMLSAAEKRIAEADREVEVDAEVGPPADNIVRYIERRDVDHVVIGSHGRTGLTRVALGSVAEKVTRRSPVPVTIIHEDWASED